MSNGIPQPISNPPKYFKSIRLTSKDFAKIDLDKFEGCMIDVFNGHFNIDIKILELMDQPKGL